MGQFRLRRNDAAAPLARRSFRASPAPHDGEMVVF
jgi:hypothetical protein